MKLVMKAPWLTEFSWQAGLDSTWNDTSDEEGYEATPDKWGLECLSFEDEDDTPPSSPTPKVQDTHIATTTNDQLSIDQLNTSPAWFLSNILSLCREGSSTHSSMIY